MKRPTHEGSRPHGRTDPMNTGIRPADIGQSLRLHSDSRESAVTKARRLLVESRVMIRQCSVVYYGPPGTASLRKQDLKTRVGVGDRYRQEYYEGEAEDLGQILKLDESVTVPYGSFESVLVTKDWTPLEPNVLENKLYVPGVGLVMERSLSGPKEALELVGIESAEPLL